MVTLNILNNINFNDIFCYKIYFQKKKNIEFMINIYFKAMHLYIISLI